MLLQQRHAIPGNTNVPEDLGLTTAIASGTYLLSFDYNDESEDDIVVASLTSDLRTSFVPNLNWIPACTTTYTYQ